jgi:transporter family-2 protein
MSKLIYLFFVIFGGAAAAVQSPINAALGKRVGVFESGLWSFATGTMILVALVLLFSKGHLTEIASVPKWQLFGGIFGVIAVISMIVAAPQLGIGLAVVGILFGQVTVGILIDTFGWFGAERIALDYNRIIGVVLMLIGVFFVYRSKIGV